MSLCHLIVCTAQLTMWTCEKAETEKDGIRPPLKTGWQTPPSLTRHRATKRLTAQQGNQNWCHETELISERCLDHNLLRQQAPAEEENVRNSIAEVGFEAHDMSACEMQHCTLACVSSTCLKPGWGLVITQDD